MDGLLSYIDEIGIIIAICFFFFGINENIKKVDSGICGLTEAIKDLQIDLKDARASGSKEHQTMIDTLSDNQKIMINTMTETNKAMAEEHKEMIKISGKQNELLVEIKANLMSHMHEERK